MGVYKTSFLRASIISHIPGKVSAQGLRFRVQGSGFRVHGFKVQGFPMKSRFRVIFLSVHRKQTGLLLSLLICP